MKTKYPQCVAIEADLVAAATGEAESTSVRRVHDHVTVCRPCRDEFERYRAIDGVVTQIRTGETAGESHVPVALTARIADLRQRRLIYSIFPSPLGRLLIARSEEGVSLVEYLGSGRGFSASRLSGAPGVEAVEDSAEVETLYGELLDYVAGRRTRLAWPLDFRLARSDFHRRVLNTTAAIPYGAVRSYSGIAAAMGAPSAVRAVAQALRSNPLPIVVPCHRVVGSSGALVGYAGDRIGLKQRLLAAEGVHTQRNQRIAPEAMYIVDDGEYYCVSNCPSLPAPTTLGRGRMVFGSRERAEAAGLQPCSTCRPDLHPTSQ